MRFLILLSIVFTAPFIAKADSGNLQADHLLGPVTHPLARDQGNVGFCWGYSFSELMESEALKQGKTVILSPEYLAFNHIFFQVAEALPDFETLDAHHGPFAFILKALMRKTFAPEGTAGLSEALAEIPHAGMVPETFFKYKFPLVDENGNPIATHPNLQDKISAFVKTNLLNKNLVATYLKNKDTLRTDLMTALGVSLPKPTDTFTYEGKTYTALTFMSDYLGFDSNNYAEVVLGKAASKAYPNHAQITTISHDDSFNIIKTALNDNVAIPLGFTIYEDQKTAINSGTFTPASCLEGHCVDALGGHAVLIVGLKEDATSNAVDALVIENSWGNVGLNDQAQITTDANQKGFFLITPDYLRQPETDGTRNWSFVVPKKYLK